MMSVRYMASIFLLAAVTDASPLHPPTSQHGKIKNIGYLHTSGSTLNNTVKSIRGGSQTTSRCVSYSKIGLVNLTAKRSEITPAADGKKKKPTKGVKSAVTYVVDEWIQSQLKADVDVEDPSTVVGNILAVPIPEDSSGSEKGEGNEFEFTLGTFNDCDKWGGKGGFALGSKQHAGIGNIIETIGAVADSVVVLYDIKNESRHAAIVRLIKGIKRQGKYRNRVEVIIIAEKGEAIDELKAISDLYAEDEGEANYSLNIVEASKYGSSVFDILHQMEENSSTKESYVPMDIFPRLVGRVYSKLSGKTLDDIETLSFGTSLLSMPKSSGAPGLLTIGLPLSILAALFAPKLDDMLRSKADAYGPYGIATMLEDEYDTEDESTGAGEAFDFDSLMDSFENP